MRVFCIYIILAVEHVKKICSDICEACYTSVMNVIHIDRSYPLRWYVIIFVIATAVAATALSRFGEVLGDYQVLCA